jgi:hypothetical protein
MASTSRKKWVYRFAMWEKGVWVDCPQAEMDPWMKYIYGTDNYSLVRVSPSWLLFRYRAIGVSTYLIIHRRF